MDDLAQATAGGVAGVFATIAVYPILLVKTRLQAQRKPINGNGTHYKGPIDCFVGILRREGALGMLRGISSSLPKAFLTNFIFYFAHAFLKRYFPKGTKTFLSDMLHGILAGVIVQIIITPLDLINTRVMAFSHDHESKDNKGILFFAEFFRVLKEHGIREFYKGITPQLLLTLNPGITNVVRSALEPSDEKRVQMNMGKSAIEDFAIGAGSKAVASVITYPLVVSKVHLYVKEKQKKHESIGDEAEDSESRAIVGVVGLMKEMLEIVKNEGIFGLYKGLETQLGGAVLKEAFLNMTRHEIYRIVIGFVMLFNANKVNPVVAKA